MPLISGTKLFSPDQLLCVCQSGLSLCVLERGPCRLPVSPGVEGASPLPLRVCFFLAGVQLRN